MAMKNIKEKTRTSIYIIIFLLIGFFIFVMQSENISAKEIFIDKNIEEQFNQNNSLFIGGREFVRYGNITVESSIYNLFIRDNRALPEIVIWLNNSDIQNEDIKKQIIESLGNDFELTYSNQAGNLFSGYLKLSGLEKLKSGNYGVIIASVTTGGKTTSGNNSLASVTTGGKTTSGNNSLYKTLEFFLLLVLIVAIIYILIRSLKKK